jgi:hypothetical protein
MSDQQDPVGKYTVHQAVQSAVGDYANVNNYLSAQAATADPGVAELRRLFEEINLQLEALEAEDREQVAVEVEQAAKLAGEIQQGDPSLKKPGFFETRLKNICRMAPAIGQVIVTTLANPSAGVALALQKIARKAQLEEDEKTTM